MSRWIRGIYNAAANFNMSGSLRAAAGRILDRDSKQLREVDKQSNKCDKPSKSCQPSESVECGDAATCLGCAPFSCARNDPNSNHYRGDDAKCSVTTIEYISRDENGNSKPVTLTITAKPTCNGTEYTYSATREDACTGVRISDELGTIKQANHGTTNPVEYSTGIPTGVTV